MHNLPGDQDKRTSQQLQDLPALDICIVDRRVSKAMLAETATELAVNARASTHEPSSTSLHLSIAELNTMIEGKGRTRRGPRVSDMLVL